MVVLTLFRVGIWLAERLPAAWLYAAAHVVGRVLAVLPTAAAGRLRHNLGQVMDLSADDPRLRPYVRQVYTTQASNYVDLLRRTRITEAEITARFEQGGPGWAPLLARRERGEPCLLVTAHFGRIELLNDYLSRQQWPITLPVERLQPPALYALICRQRERPLLQLVPHDAAIRPCLRALARGEVVALFAEWDPSGEGVPVQFFGRPTRFPGGPAFLALRSGAPVFVGFDLPGEAPGRARAYIGAPLVAEREGDLDDDVQRLTQQIAEQFEAAIRRAPGQWVMFHDIWAAGVSQSVARPAPGAAR